MSEYCRACGRQNNSMLVFALPGLCMDCHKRTSIGDLYDTATGEAIPCVPANPAPKHDGRLDSWSGADVRLFPFTAGGSSPNGPCVLITVTGQRDIALFPQQALSLLAWLKQEEEALKELAKAEEKK